MTTPTPSKNKHLPTPITEQYIGRQLQDRPEWVDAELCRDFERELAAAQEALKNHLHLDNHNAIVRQLEERAQRAEALAESNLNALNRFKEEREGNTRQFRRLQHRLAQSEADNFSLAAGQCIVTNGGLMGDDHGHLYCDMQRQRDELRGRIRLMADIMNTALDVIKTVEGDGSDEDEALMHIRAKMASAIDSVRRADKSAIDAAREGK